MTEHVPKSLLNVAGRPFLDWQLQWLERQSVERVFISVGYLGEMIQDFVGAYDRWNLKIELIDEGEMMLGTGGAVRLAIERGLSGPFLLTYGDSYLQVNIKDVCRFYADSTYRGVMTVILNNYGCYKSNVDYADGRVLAYDNNNSPTGRKFQFLDYGLSILHSDDLGAYLPLNFSGDLCAYFAPVAANGTLGGYLARERFYEIGSIKGYHALEAYLLRHS